MSYVVQCPNCGHTLGSGHVQEHHESGALLNFSVSALRVPEEQVQYMVPPPKQPDTGGK